MWWLWHQEQPTLCLWAETKHTVWSNWAHYVDQGKVAIEDGYDLRNRGIADQLQEHRNVGDLPSYAKATHANGVIALGFASQSKLRIMVAKMAVAVAMAIESDHTIAHNDFGSLVRSAVSAHREFA